MDDPATQVQAAVDPLSPLLQVGITGAVPRRRRAAALR
jgi:hypothetical protein